MTKREEFIVLLDSDKVHTSDAIIILEGDGLARYKRAVELYQARIAPKICFSGKLDDQKSGAITFDVIKPLILEMGVPENDILFEDKSLNTYEQAVEIIKMAKIEKWHRITIVASQYHSYRAFLTFLHEQNKNYPSLIMDMESIMDLDWYEETGYGRRIDLLNIEFEKIDLYQEKDNVSSYEKGLEYLRWKYQEQKK